MDFTIKQLEVYTSHQVDLNKNESVLLEFISVLWGVGRVSAQHQRSS